MTSKNQFSGLIIVLVVIASSLVASLVSILVHTPVWAQAERAYSIPGNRIVAIDEALDRRSLVIHLENATPAGPPIFKYLPGADGETVLTADFVGLAWNSPPRIIRLISSENGFRSANPTGIQTAIQTGIKEVRVGQFIDSPAVLRISFVARDPRVLKSVAIASGPGLLQVSWGANIAAPARLANSVNSIASTLPPTAPPAAAKPEVVPKQSGGGWLSRFGVGRKKSSQAQAAAGQVDKQALSANGAAVSPAKSAGATSASVGAATGPDENRLIFRTLGPFKADSKDNADSGSAEARPSPDTAFGGADATPTVSLESCNDLDSGATKEIFRVEMPPGRELSFRTFRLHDPERYVIDIPNCRSLANALLPDVTSSALLSSLRVGVPSAASGTGRLVLQLRDSQVNVAENFTPGSNYFSVTLGKGLMLDSEGGGQTSEKFSSADIAPGPIIVPRAPSETVVVLDAGHGGSDPGAVRSDVQEKDITLGIIQKLKKILEARGARIVLTRQDDTFVSLEDRVKITNQVGPNLFLSVHINSLESTSNIYGIETYFQTDLSRPLAERVHASLVAGLGTPDRNIRRARFYVINHTPVPAILAEVGYITNKAERDRLISSDYQQKVASALARGVMLYLRDTGAAASRLANSARGQRARSPQ